MRREGLTLMELLIVIAIIVVLLGIVIAITSEVRFRVGVTQCSSNLHQIGLALRMYTHDWGGFAPPYSTFPPEQSLLLITAFQPYTKNEDIWHCPCDPGGWVVWTETPRWRSQKRYLKYHHGFTSYRIMERYSFTPIPIDNPPVLLPTDIKYNPRCAECVLCMKLLKEHTRWVYATCSLHEKFPSRADENFGIVLYLDGRVVARWWPEFLHSCPTKQLPSNWPYED